MQDWDDLKYCLALDKFRTMTAAAKALGTTTALFHTALKG